MQMEFRPLTKYMTLVSYLTLSQKANKRISQNAKLFLYTKWKAEKHSATNRLVLKSQWDSFQTNCSVDKYKKKSK